MTTTHWVSRFTDVADERSAGRRDRLERRRHVVAVLLATAALLATARGWTPSSASALTIVFAAVALGMPHGALDVVVGRRMVRASVFFELYLTVAVITAVIWIVAPVVGLSAFFVASWFHFARGDAAHRRGLGGAAALSGMSTAGCAIGLPLALHSALVTPVLSDLLLGTAAPTAAQVAAVGWMIACPSLVTGVVAGLAAIQSRQYAALVEITVIALLAGSVHPLVSFALYFSLWHSPRHLISLDVDRTTWTRTFGATAAMLLLGAAAWRWTQPSAETATRAVFIGLAALTWPHLGVTEMFRRRLSCQP